MFLPELWEWLEERRGPRGPVGSDLQPVPHLPQGGGPELSPGACQGPFKNRVWVLVPLYVVSPDQCRELCCTGNQPRVGDAVVRVAGSCQGSEFCRIPLRPPRRLALKDGDLGLFQCTANGAGMHFNSSIGEVLWPHASEL